MSDDYEKFVDKFESFQLKKLDKFDKEKLLKFLER